MRYMLIMVLALLGCGANETTTGGNGGQGGETSQGGGGEGGGCADPHDARCIPIEPEPEGGAGGGAPIVATSEPDYPMTASDIVDGLISGECGPFAPGASEDQSWARVQMRSAGGTHDTLRFATVRSPSLAAPLARVIGWGVVANAIGPEQIDCTIYGTSYDLAEIDGESTVDAAGNPVEVVIHEFTVPPSDTLPGDWDVACIRMDTDADGEGHPGNLLACGKDACQDDRDQWQDSKADGGEVHAMGSYGPNYCRAWMVSVQ